MEIRCKINQRNTNVSPRGFNINSVSPSGFNCCSVSLRGFNSILFILLFSFSLFAQTEGKYDVIINKNSKITFTGFAVNKMQPFPSYKHYEVVLPLNNWMLNGNSGTIQSNNFIGTTDNIGLSFRTNNIIRQTITNSGNVGIGTISPTSIFHVESFVPVVKINNTAPFANSELSFTQSGSAGDLPAYIRYSNSSDVFQITLQKISGTTDLLQYKRTTNNIGIGIKTGAEIAPNVGIGTLTPTSIFQVNGSIAESVTIVSATTVLNNSQNKIVVNNAATSITITLPDALTCLGRKYEISRYAGSTGTITVQGSAGNQIQALAGTVGATTTLRAHSAAGAGLNHIFTAVQVGATGVWVRL